jgi:hypothetical protein
VNRLNRVHRTLFEPYAPAFFAAGLRMPPRRERQLPLVRPYVTTKEATMTLRPNAVRFACLIAASSFCAVAGAANLSASAYKTAKDQAKAEYKKELDACSPLSGNAKDICVETAKGREKVALAHLEYQRTGDAKDLTKLGEARYEAQYQVAKERCDDLSGNPKDVCVTQAKAERDKAKADVQAGKELREARDEAQKTKDEADYKVAQSRCDTLSGDTKDGCVAAARARFNQ